MPRGAAVIAYHGKRGTVWRIKYADAEGRQVMETIGPESEGWTRKKAEAELRARLVRVERRGWRKPAPLTFASYAATWLAEGQTRRRWAPRTVIQYRSIVKRLGETFGPMPLGAFGRATSRSTSPSRASSLRRPRWGETCPCCTTSSRRPCGRS